MPTNIDWKKFDQVLMHTRGYFVLQYRAGTREMVYRYVVSKIGDVPPVLVSAALKIMKKEASIIYDKKVWWFLGER
jgi:hypothetical protein